MITEFIFNILCFLPNQLLDSIDGLSISIPDNVFDGFNSILGSLGYIFPVKGLLIILGLSFSIKAFQLVWALIIRIKSFIPTMGA